MFSTPFLIAAEKILPPFYEDTCETAFTYSPRFRPSEFFDHYILLPFSASTADTISASETLSPSMLRGPWKARAWLDTLNRASWSFTFSFQIAQQRGRLFLFPLSFFFSSDPPVSAPFFSSFI